MTEGKLSVLHVITDLNTGGAERMLYRLVSQQVGSNITPIVISLMDRGRLGPLFEEMGVPIYTLGMKRSRFSWNDWRRLRGLIATCTPDVVHGWMYHGNLASLLSLPRKKRVPLIWHIHNTVSDLGSENRLTEGIVRLGAPLSRLVDKVVYCGPETARQHENIGYASQRTAVIPNGTDCCEYAPDSESRKLVRNQLGIPESAKLVGHIARFHPMKDHASMLLSARIVCGQRPEVHFLLAGSDVVPQNPKIAELWEKLDLRSVHLLGERRDIPRIMAALDVFALSSSRAESFPLVLGEAMASGVPCVTTDVGDSAWVVGDTGVVVPPSVPENLAAGILKLLSLSESEFQHLQSAARRRISEQFSLESVAKQFSELYDALVAKTSFSP